MDGQQTELLHDICDDSCKGTALEWPTSRDLMLTDSMSSRMADIFKTLGDPTRIKLIYALLEHERCVHELSDLLDMGQSAVSHQLRYLRNVRIVKRRKVGKTVYYSLDDNHIEQIFTQTLQHLTHV